MFLIKQTECLCIFDGKRSDLVGIGKDRKAKTLGPFFFNFDSISLEISIKMILLFFEKTKGFYYFCEIFQSQPLANHNTIYQAAGHLPGHILGIKNLQNN